MARMYLGIFAAIVAFSLPTQAIAQPVVTYSLFNHGDASASPPPYGLTLNKLIDNDHRCTFDFEYSDANGTSDMKLDYDPMTNTIRIHGRVYGGMDVGDAYDAVEQGWADVDFTYRDNIIVADNADGDPGNDLYVIAESPNNNGTIELDGWGGNQTFNLEDKWSSDVENSFSFDDDYDPRDPPAGTDPSIISGFGWLRIPGTNISSRDWVFQAMQDEPTSIDASSFGTLKALYR